MARLSSGIAQEGETVAHDEGDADLQRAILWSMLSTAGTVKLPQASASQMSLALEAGHRNNTAMQSAATAASGNDVDDADLQRAIHLSLLSVPAAVDTAYASSSYQRPAASATTALHASVIFT